MENSFNFLPVSISSIVEPDIAVPVTGQPINSSHTGYPAVSLVPKPFHITQKNPYNIIKVIINIATCILSCMQSVLIYLPMILLEIICWSKNIFIWSLCYLLVCITDWSQSTQTGFLLDEGIWRNWNVVFSSKTNTLHLQEGIQYLQTVQSWSEAKCPEICIVRESDPQHQLSWPSHLFLLAYTIWKLKYSKFCVLNGIILFKFSSRFF